MCLPDYLLDEPDQRICDEHQASLPCRACAADEADREHDERME